MEIPPPGGSTDGAGRLQRFEKAVGSLGFAAQGDGAAFAAMGKALTGPEGVAAR